ncbi:MAG: adenylate/guanylate cyclase domain-containing protein [Gammaproteobacteria bacterium]|nr:adenylate/guanylate cyclase domain-containing protein [Gammaproteobacteria bacterium]
MDHANASEHAVMFVRICNADSAKRPGTLDDAAIRERVTALLSELIQCGEQQGGRLVKTLGDEMLFTFPSVAQAATAACHIQEWVDGTGPIRDGGAAVRLACRVGLHFGPVLFENGDIFGDTVNVAARMLAIAKPTQIITTTPARVRMPPILRANSRLIDRTQVKGKQEQLDIFEILWCHDDLTHISTGAAGTGPRGRELDLFLDGERFRVNAEQPTLVIGRSRAADIPIREELASRQHARIEYRRDSFFLVDQSTNGTFLEQDGIVTFVRRDVMLLSGTGRICFGRPFSENPGQVLNFDAG